MTIENSLDTIKERGFKYCRIMKKGSTDPIIVLSMMPTNKDLLNSLKRIFSRLDPGQYVLSCKKEDNGKETTVSNIPLDITGGYVVPSETDLQVSGSAKSFYTPEDMETLRAKLREEIENEFSLEDENEYLKETIVELRKEIETLKAPSGQIGAIFSNVLNSFVGNIQSKLSGTTLNVSKNASADPITENNINEDQKVEIALEIFLKHAGADYFYTVAKAIDKNPGLIDQLKMFIK